MSSYIISPDSKIEGSVKISGSKNASLPIMSAAILSDCSVTLKNIPDLTDIENMCTVLECVGAECIRRGGELVISPDIRKRRPIPPAVSGSLRGSFLIIGSALSKYGNIKISLPGGCSIGARPIDLHLKGLAAMGADITQGHGYVELKCKQLRGANIYLDFPSVGATENIMLAASKIPEETVIENAATEPEIIDLAGFLISMGTEILGAGSERIIIRGSRKLCVSEYTVIPDRIEAGTFMSVAAACRCELKIKNVIPNHLKPVIAKLTEMGFTVNELKKPKTENSVTENKSIISSYGFARNICDNESKCLPNSEELPFLDHSGNYITNIEVRPGGEFKSVDIKTLPYPGFPTDMQAQFTSLLSIADGTSIVSETVFENRFMHIPQLMRMGAKIKIDGRCAIIEGVKRLSGAKVKATDLRAGASLVIAALSAQGETEIENIEYIERGYEEFDKKLSSIGVKIKKVNSL